MPPEIIARQKPTKEGARLFCGRARHFGWDDNKQCPGDLGFLRPGRHPNTWVIDHPRGYVLSEPERRIYKIGHPRKESRPKVLGADGVFVACPNCQFRNHIALPTDA
jgi:hypothetical protein